MFSRRGYSLAAATLLTVAVFGSAWLFKGYTPMQAVRFFRAPSPSELPSIGQPIVDALVTYRAEHGRFPESLAPLNLPSTDTFYGPWDYRVSDDGISCQLSVGDYGRYLFEVSWTNSNGWYVDT